MKMMKEPRGTRDQSWIGMATSPGGDYTRPSFDRGSRREIQGSQVTTLAVPGTTFATAFGINDHGDVTGFYFDSTGTHGYLYSSGKYTTLDVPGTFSTLAFGINNAGQIVGEYDDSTGTHGSRDRPHHRLVSVFHQVGGALRFGTASFVGPAFRDDSLRSALSSLRTLSTCWGPKILS